MSDKDKNHSCHSKHSQHKGHGWMMIVCVLLMIGGPILFLVSDTNTFSPSLFATALLPLILCLVMHGLMMKLMMSGSQKSSDSSRENNNPKDIKMLEHQSDIDNRFNA